MRARGAALPFSRASAFLWLPTARYRVAARPGPSNSLPRAAARPPGEICMASGESRSKAILPSPTVHSGLRAFRPDHTAPTTRHFRSYRRSVRNISGRPGRQNAGCQSASGFVGFIVGNENPLKHFSFLLRFQPLKTLTVNLCPAHMRHMPAGAMLPRIRVASHSSKCTAKTTCKRLKISADGTIKVTHCWQLLNNWHSAVKDLGAGGRCDSNSRLDLGQPPKWFM